MTVYAITDTKKGRTGIAPTYLQTTHIQLIKFWHIFCIIDQLFIYELAVPSLDKLEPNRAGWDILDQVG